MQKKKRKYVNYDAVEEMYRAGRMTLAQICSQYAADHKHSTVWKRTIDHSTIVKRAKLKGWTRNLVKQVNKRIKEKLITDLATNLATNCGESKKRSEAEMVEHAAEAGSQVVFRHRKEISALIAQEEKLLDELINNPTKLFISRYQDKIISEEVGLTVKEKSATLKDLAAVRAQRIALERQAFNLDGDEKEESDVDKLSEDQIDARIRLLIKGRCLDDFGA